jgi:hypothetical protein
MMQSSIFAILMCAKQCSCLTRLSGAELSIRQKESGKNWPRERKRGDSEIALPYRSSSSAYRFHNLTPGPSGPPPFSAINSIPADSRAERMSLRR